MGGYAGRSLIIQGYNFLTFHRACDMQSHGTIGIEGLLYGVYLFTRIELNHLAGCDLSEHDTTTKK